VRTAEDIERKAQDIDKKRQEHHNLFKVALDTIMRRLKDYEQDCDKKGMQVEKFGHLDKVAEDEQNQIV
jgi:ATP-dependent protease ClpP protease subunit